MLHEFSQNQELAAKFAEIQESLQGGRVVDIVGPIEQGDEKKWLAKFQELLLQGDGPIVLRLNTPGGYIKSANDFATEIGNLQEQGKARKIYTLAHNHCASAGTYLLLSLGTSGIFSTPNTTIRFHGSVDTNISEEAKKPYHVINWGLEFILNERNPFIEWKNAIENDQSFSAESARSAMLIDGIVTM